jgi:hypothetical protein
VRGSRTLAAGAAVTVLAWAATAGAQAAPAAPTTIAIADWQLAPVLDLRVRGDYRYDLDHLHRAMALERARLGADVSHGPIEVRLVLQDARAYVLTTGDMFVAGPSPTALTGAYEAWVDVHTPTTHPSFVRIGRQPVVWGEGRLLGIADWSPTGRSLDAVRGRLVFGDGAAELLAAVLEAPPPTAFALDAYASLYGARGEWAVDPLFAAEAYVLARVAYYEPLVVTSSSLQGQAHQGQTYTGALRLHGQGQGWSWGAEGAYQLGHIDGVAHYGATFTGARAGWAVAGHVAKTLDNVVLTPTIGVGGAYASGDEPGNTYRTFDPIQPDIHVWHGAMDLFSWSNEVEGNAHVGIVPWTDAQARLEYRYARLAQAGDAWRSAYVTNIALVPSNTKADLGHEIDATLRWAPWTPFELEGGYSILVMGSGARAIVAAQHGSSAQVSHYAYLQARVTF